MRTALAGLALGVMLSVPLVVAVERADARSTCADAYSAPRRVVNACRSDGWIVRPWLTVSPSRHLRYFGGTEERVCRTEDVGALGESFTGCVYFTDRPHHVILHTSHGVRVVGLRTAR